MSVYRYGKTSDVQNVHKDQVGASHSCPFESVALHGDEAHFVCSVLFIGE